MTVWAAIAWGAFSSGSLFLGQALAGPLAGAHRTTAMIMGFGAGTLLSAVAYELIPESSLDEGLGIGTAFLAGAVTYYVGDRIIDSSGGDDRQDLDAEGGGSGMAMFFGALLDGLPEAFILGITIALGGSVSVAFVVAVFVSNIPQGLAGTTSMRAAGVTTRRITGSWAALTLACALVAAAGFGLADWVPHGGRHAEAFAGGAVLTMLADSMMPEAFEHGGRAVGLVTVLGYLVAAFLTLAG